MLTLTLAAVVLGLVLIREWMAQHILGDPPKPADAVPEPGQPIYVLNGIVMKNRHDAYLMYAMDVEVPLHVNLLEASEFQRAKRAILHTATRDRLKVRIKDVQIYLRGNPYVGEAPLDSEAIGKIKTMELEGTVGDLRDSSEPNLMAIYPTIHGIMERLFDATKGCTNPGRDAFTPTMGDGNLEPTKIQTASGPSPTDALAALQAASNPLPPSLPGADLSHGTPPADSPTQSSTPPRPVNADDKGFDEHVSFSAPELLVDRENAHFNEAETVIASFTDAGPSSHLSGPDQLRQARLARFEKRQSMKARAEVETAADEAIDAHATDAESTPAVEPIAVGAESSTKLGESSRTADMKEDRGAEDADGWETDNSDGHSNDSARQTIDHASLFSSTDGHIGTDRSLEPSVDERLQPARPSFESGLSPAKHMYLTDTQTLFLDAEGSHQTVDIIDGSRHPPRIPIINPADRDGPETIYFRRDPRQPILPVVPMEMGLTPLPPFAPIPTPPLLAADDDAEDDAEEEEGEDEDEQEDEPEQEPHVHDHNHDHVHNPEDMDELDREDWNGVLEGELTLIIDEIFADQTVVGLIGPIQNLAQNVSHEALDASV